LFFNFDVDPTTPYGTIFDYGILGQNGIPRDFFADIDVRKAFARLIDFQSLIDQAYQEATQPTTAIIPGLPYYDPSIPKYTYDPANATLHFQQAWGGQLWNTGFTIQLVYNQGNTIRQILCNMLETNIENLNPNFMVTVTQLSPWSEYGDARNGRQLTIFDLGWLADYPDPHNFAYGFYYSPGAFAWLASYADPTMDALIELGIRTPDGQERAQIYHDIQQRVIDTCPSVALFQSTGRHFERDWIVGWYYNPVCYGNYPANCWKWYYLPQSLQDTTTTSNLPADLNYDGKVNIYDIAITATRFRVLAWPSIDSRWLFRCDFNNDRKIDGRDIAYVARNFGGQSPVWTPTP
jgi:peptide/nickel transport system substrate-binding protein